MINITPILKQENLAALEQDVLVRTITDLSSAGEQDLSFALGEKFAADLSATKAGVVFVRDGMQDLAPKGTLALGFKNPYLAVAKLSGYFASPLIMESGADPIVGSSTKILPNVFIGKNTVIGDDCTILAGAYIGNNVCIGNSCVIYPNVSIYDGTQIGNNVRIHAGAVIGSDGFGYVQDAEFNHHKIYHLGTVRLEDDVEIGANTTIDRAVWSQTIVKKGTKLDNLIQVGHNCVIGEKCVAASQTGFAGSSELGSCCMVGAQSGVAGHLKVGSGAILAARSGVTKSIKGGGIVYAGFPLFQKREWLKIQAKIAGLIKNEK
ncbi:MAG: UDP-3-O-(3-hydroxymyristoyl)glucosamine N-acyltransferase [Helicobacteraceae bacterium]